MHKITLAKIAEITGGQVFGDPNLTVSSIAIDSRNTAENWLFAAIKGEHVDGHEFAGQAMENGAVASLVTHAIAGPHVLVPAIDSEIYPIAYALGKVAAHERAQFTDVNVVGVTGSSGKTSTKDIIRQVLEHSGKTQATSGSQNNELGLPLTILNADIDVQNLVLEMGMRGLGHISYLCEIASPTISVVTNVGQAHIGEVGSIENIAKAKSEIVQELRDENWAILNYDDPNVLNMRNLTSAQVITYGLSSAADVRALNISSDVSGTYEFDIQTADEIAHVELPLLGEHNILNALAATAVGIVCGMKLSTIVQALSSVNLLSPWRMEKSVLDNGVVVINDAYNANPESMSAALRALAGIAPSGHSWAVLGAMAELGEFSIEQHDAVGRLAVRLDISNLVVVGEQAKALYLGALQEGSWDGESVWFPDFSSACDYIVERVKSPDVLLFKASRAEKFEQLAQMVSDALTDGGSAE
ncbi:MAG: UDP-N-acetylmuramoyl-tripeptide--D-alanyl-D-alanine ligase [Actinobacteria bacterium]|nr:UDP-N-acetylmuramoyl-tripeptide--D-alanyl-D-alanine ligase [Actinomycetota bacterium]